MSEAQAVVHVLDDNKSFRKSISRLLRACGYEVCDYDSVPAFLESYVGGRPGCILSVLRMPGQSDLDLQKALVEAGASIPVIFLSGHGDIPVTVTAMRDGAEDFLTKPVKKEILLKVIERALDRDAVFRKREALLDDLRARFGALTSREREVLSQVVAGRLNKQIAYDLGTSERTVKAHRANIVEKLGVRSVAETVRMSEAVDFPPADYSVN